MKKVLSMSSKKRVEDIKASTVEDLIRAVTNLMTECCSTLEELRKLFPDEVVFVTSKKD